jgi:hypothetical protein
LALLFSWVCIAGGKSIEERPFSSKLQKQGALPRGPCFSNFDFLAV